VAAVAWLKQLVLPEIDRLEMNHLLVTLEQVQQRLKGLEKVIAQRSGVSKAVVILSSMPGMKTGFTAMSLACRVGRVERFPRAHSLANYWGLTPGCRNSGENNQRLGSITKAGSTTARWLLAQLVHKVLRRDERLREWFRRIKRRRGAMIARVAVMRKLATIIWHMLSKRKTYAECRELAAACTTMDLALWCQSRMEEGGIVPPHSVLAPGTALGLLPSSCPIFRPGRLHCSRTLFRELQE
jgi:hypothetical protein